MSVVRSSKFRHVFGKTVRKEEQYENVQVSELHRGRGRHRLRSGHSSHEAADRPIGSRSAAERRAAALSRHACPCLAVISTSTCVCALA